MFPDGSDQVIVRLVVGVAEQLKVTALPVTTVTVELLVLICNGSGWQGAVTSGTQVPPNPTVLPAELVGVEQLPLDVILFEFSHVLNQYRLQSQSHGFPSRESDVSDVFIGLATPTSRVVREFEEMSRLCKDVKPVKAAGNISVIELVPKSSDVRDDKLVDDENAWSRRLRAFCERSIVAIAVSN